MIKSIYDKIDDIKIQRKKINIKKLNIIANNDCSNNVLFIDDKFILRNRSL